MKRPPLSLLVVAIALVAGGPARLAAEPTAQEYGVKAVFLYQFTKFIDWPTAAFASADAPFEICVLGDASFGGTLDALNRKKVHGRDLVARRVASVEEARGCQIVFVTRAEESRYEAVLAALSGRPIVTVGEVDGFAQAGGMLNFLVVDGRVRFEINRNAARQAGVSVTSPLLQVATAVHGED